MMNSMCCEIWKDIKDYEELYQISNKGKVRNKRTNNILKNNIGTTGYYQVHLRNQGKPRTFLVHRLVGQAFVLNENNLPEVNHIDENKLNNLPSNLEWVTSKENCNHGTRIARCNGVRRNNTKNMKEVKGVSLIGDRTIVFPSANEAGRNGFDKSSVINCCNGKHGAKTHKGYRWSYT